MLEGMKRRSLCLGVLLLAGVLLGSAACGPDGAAAPTDADLPATTTPMFSSDNAVSPGEETPDGLPPGVEDATVVSPTTAVPASGAATTITVLYDNAVLVAGTRADWGFSCLIEGLEQTVLFDTGADADILLANMEVVREQPEDIDIVVLSHDHNDHTAGLAGVVGVNSDVAVYHPSSFAKRSVAAAREAGATVVPVDAAVRLCAGLTMTAPGGEPAESALLIDTTRGPVLVTGCAHAGIVEMVAAATDLAGEPIFAVLGGFHLASLTGEEVDDVISGLKALGVRRCGPAHCTGEVAQTRMRDAFGTGFIEMGVGAIVTF